MDNIGFDFLSPNGEINDVLAEELIKDLIDQRKIILNKEIDDTLLENVSLQIMKFNQQDHNLPVNKRKPIWIYVQTCGGDVFSGLGLIDVINSSITPVHTVCFAQCASMGFHIFISGHKRYAFKNSILMMHDGDICIQNSDSKAKDIMNFLDMVNDRIKEHVLNNTKITTEEYDDKYSHDWYFFADTTGKEKGCVDYIIGQDICLNELFSLEVVQ